MNKRRLTGPRRFVGCLNQKKAHARAICVWLLRTFPDREFIDLKNWVHAHQLEFNLLSGTQCFKTGRQINFEKIQDHINFKEIHNVLIAEKIQDQSNIRTFPLHINYETTCDLSGSEKINNQINFEYLEDYAYFEKP